MSYNDKLLIQSLTEVGVDVGVLVGVDVGLDVGVDVGVCRQDMKVGYKVQLE